MPNNDEENVTLENIQIIYRNFAGREGPFNRAGNRNFAALLTPEMAAGLSASGWNVKTTKERELDEGSGEIVGGEPYLPVTVGYKIRPPRVIMISQRGRTSLDEGLISLLDDADIRNVDIIVHPSDWKVNGNTGRKAYLKSGFFTIHEDELDLKYADVPVIGGAVYTGPGADD